MDLIDSTLKNPDTAERQHEHIFQKKKVKVHLTTTFGLSFADFSFFLRFFQWS